MNATQVDGIARHHSANHALPVRCLEIGHSRVNKVHTGDSWIAASAIRLGLPLASHDGVFDGAPGLEFITANPDL